MGRLLPHLALLRCFAMAHHPKFFLPLVLLLACAGHLAAADWPMSRYDAQRGAATTQELPAELHLHWRRSFPPLKPAWPDQLKMQFDAAYDPVILGTRLFLASSRHDWVAAFDVASGKELWRFFAEGPVRFAPAAADNRVYFASDDGYLYCLAADKGTLEWKFRGGPSDRKILGNERLISTWPARGAPVLADGKVYFAASIWPFMGIFIHALDAKTGRVVWTNDGDGSVYIKQPHNTDSFAGVAPQGPMVLLNDYLLVPGGRSVPATFDRHTGKMLKYQLAENGKRGGGSEVAAMGGYFFNGGACFDAKTEKYLGEVGRPIALTPTHVFAYSAGAVRVYSLKSAEEKEVETVDRLGKKTKVKRWTMDEIASCKTPPLECLIKAGSRLYGGTKGLLLALDFDPVKKSLTPGWQQDLAGIPVRLAAAAERLFVVTQEGAVLCYGAHKVTTESFADTKVSIPEPRDGWTEKVRRILERTQMRDGYCVVYGVGSGRLALELVRQSDLRVIVVERDAAKVDALRELIVTLDLDRLSVLHAEPIELSLPPYLASLALSESWQAAGFDLQGKLLQKVFQTLRPYGGKAVFLASTVGPSVPDLVTQLKLAGAATEADTDMVLVVREGALPGAANWTHEHGDAANTRVSADQLVKAPLGLLWFGGPSHEGVLPRHGHGPQPQVIDGRMIIEGVDMLRCIDIYTGRLLWESKLPGVGAFYNNLAHQPGANSSGGNYVSMSDGIYVAYQDTCVVLDPATGKKLRQFQLPLLGDMKTPPRWGYINVAGDYLIGGADPLLDPKMLPPPPKAGDGDDPDFADKKKDSTLTKIVKAVKGFSDNLSSSRHLVVMDRRSGKVLWTASAVNGFRHNAICVGGGRLYTIDRLSGQQADRLKRLGQEPKSPPRLFAFDLATGKELWSVDTEVFGTWLSYSAKFDVLVEAGRVARDTISDEPKGMRAYRAKDGKTLWFDKAYTGPAMIHGDTILQGQGGCDLLTGALKMRVDPISGVQTPWTWIRTYGCNTPAASEHLLTFRSGAAGYFDLCGDGGTGNFGGFRSSCTNNLIVAGGILTAPDYTRTCTCLYQNQTSIALVHMPDAEMWTYFGVKDVKGPVRRVGINLGAPGDRKADDGTLWLEWPMVGGTSPALQVTTKPATPETFRRHASAVSGPASWITASGVKGLEELTITLDKNDGGVYTVRLYFAEPEELRPGARVFSVLVQGKTAVKDLDVCAEAGGPRRSLVKEVKGVAADGKLTIRLVPSAQASVRAPILSGVEIMAEDRK